MLSRISTQPSSKVNLNEGSDCSKDSPESPKQTTLSTLERRTLDEKAANFINANDREPRPLDKVQYTQKDPIKMSDQELSRCLVSENPEDFKKVLDAIRDKTIDPNKLYTFATAEGSAEQPKDTLLSFLVRQANSSSEAEAQAQLISRIDQLIESGADIETPLESGFNVLHLAAKLGNIEVLGCLVRAVEAQQKNIDSVDPEKKCTPVHIAIIFGNPGCTELLLNAGASIMAPAANGYRAIHIASKYGDTESIKYICKIDPLATGHSTSEGVSIDGERIPLNLLPLHIAAINDKTDAIKCLIELGADTNAVNQVGDTALHSAAANNAKKSLAVLAKMNPNLLYIKNNFSYTPLACALVNKALKSIPILVKLLREYPSLKPRINAVIEKAKSVAEVSKVKQLLENLELQASTIH